MLNSVERMLTSKWCLVGLLLLAFGLRVYALSAPSLWLDEAYTWSFVRQPWGELFNSLRLDMVHPPAYFCLEKIVIQALGDQEWSLRIASVFVDMLALAGFIRIGQLAGGSIGGLVSACFWAFRPMTIWYAGEARPYALAGALACALVAVFLILQRRQARRLWLAAAAIMTAGLVVHYFFFLVIAALTLWVMVALRHVSRFLRNWLVCVLLAAIPLMLWLYWLFQRPDVTLGIGWIIRPLPGDYPKALWNLFSGYGNVWTAGSALFGVIGLVFIAAGLLFDSAHHLARRALVFGILLPLGAVWLISQARPIYVDRYFIVLLPFVGIMVSAGARALWDRVHSPSPGRSALAAVHGLLLAFIIGGLLAGWSVHTEPGYSREDWRSLAMMLTQQSKPLPEIWLTDPESMIPLQYYYHGELPLSHSMTPPVCAAACWYIVRQSYPVGHPLYRQVEDPPELAPDCNAQLDWASLTGLAVWKVKCV